MAPQPQANVNPTSKTNANTKNPPAPPNHSAGKHPAILQVSRFFWLVSACLFLLATLGAALLFLPNGPFMGHNFAAGIVNFRIRHGLTLPLLQITAWLGKLHLIGLFGFLVLLALLAALYTLLSLAKHKKRKIAVFLSIFCILGSLLVPFGSAFLFTNLALGAYTNTAFDIASPAADPNSYQQAYEAALSELPNSPAAATLALGKLMADVEGGKLNMEGLSDADYITLAETVCYLVDAQGGVQSAQQHYFRNQFSRAPQTLDKMVQTIRQNPQNPFGWRLLTPAETLYHMMGPSGVYNLKFISKDGHFEAVYNKQGALLTAQTGALDMGTFNYASPLTSLAKHSRYDVAPYIRWNNTPGLGPVTKNEAKAMQQAFNATPEAKQHYQEVAASLQ